MISHMLWENSDCFIVLVFSVVSVHSNYIGISFFHSYLKLLYMILFVWKNKPCSRSWVLTKVKDTEGKVFHMETHRLCFSKSQLNGWEKHKTFFLHNTAGILIWSCSELKETWKWDFLHSNEIPGFSSDQNFVPSEGISYIILHVKISILSWLLQSQPIGNYHHSIKFFAKLFTHFKGQIIAHFWVPLSHSIKASLSAKFLLW